MPNGDTRLDRITTMKRGGKRRRTRRRSLRRSNRKSQRARGGAIDTSGYVLAGFKTSLGIDAPGFPIFLRNEKSLKSRLPWRAIGHGGPSGTHLIVPVLYELNYRGVDYRQTQNPPGTGNAPRSISLYDENEEPYIRAGLNESKEKIREMELKYPGLFQRMFITEEEERQALEEVQRKQLERSQNPPLRKINRTVEKRIPDAFIPRSI